MSQVQDNIHFFSREYTRTGMSQVQDNINFTFKPETAFEKEGNRRTARSKNGAAQCKLYKDDLGQAIPPQGGSAAGGFAEADGLG
jgi:hypothetical protein